MNETTADGPGSFPYRDSSLAVDQRVEDLLGRMTLEDKAGLMFHTIAGPGELDAPHPIFGGPSISELVTSGRLNHFNIYGASGQGTAELAQWHNAVQRLAAAQPLGIPVTLSSDPRHHFVDNPFASMFMEQTAAWPEPLGLAAIGSEEVVHEFADIARQEYLAVGLRVGLHPQIDLATEPRWGRISGTFGEDADLTSRLAAAYIRGFQGDVLGPASVAMMTKHFPGGGPQKDGDDPHFPWGREQVYPGSMFDYHLAPFRAAIDAGTSQMMPYYGMPVGTEYEEVGFGYNRSVVTGILRDELDFDGIVCTDWGLVSGITDLGDVGVDLGEIGAAKAWGVEHLSREERVRKVVEAGVDQFGGEHCPELVVRLVKAGKLSEARVDESVRRLLREKFVLGLFDDPYVDVAAATTIVGRQEFRDAARRAQHASVTVLVNADTGIGAPLLPLRADLRVYPEGCSAEAVERHATVVGDPADADVAVIRLKAPKDESSIFPRGSLEFPADDVARALALCARVATVIDVYLDRPAVLTPFVDAAAAIVVNYGITEAALLEVLFGAASPQGRLPFDLPRSDEAVEASRSDVPFDTEDPVFRFGHGLRYRT
jgi:beta-glucosidase